MPLVIIGIALLALFLFGRRDDADTSTPGPDAAIGDIDAPDESGEPETTTTETTTTTTEPARQATADDPLRVLIAGDSLVGYLPLVTEEALEGEPAVIIDAWKGSSGLARPDFHDWPADLARLMEEHDPDVVLIGFGGNDTQGLISTDPGVAPIDRGDPEWQVGYSERVGEALDAVEGPGRTLYWIGLPLSDRANLEEMREAMTTSFQEQIAERPWATYVDTLEVLAPDGTYRTHLEGADGESVRVRADDGIHLSPAGMRMILDLFIGDIEEAHGLGGTD